MSDIEIGIDPVIQRIIDFYYALGVWRNDDESVPRNFTRISIFLFCAISYPVALLGGCLVSSELRDLIFLLTLGIGITIIEFKGCFLFFKQNKILTLINATCNLSVPNNERLLHKVKKKLNIFKKCCVIFIVLSLVLTLSIIIVSSPLISNKLQFNIWFPLDYKTSRAAHWIVHFFFFINELFVMQVSLLSSIMWYVLLNCSIKYDVLGYRFKNVGVAVKLDNHKKAKNRDLYESELIECIGLHKQLAKYGIIQVIKVYSLCQMIFCLPEM